MFILTQQDYEETRIIAVSADKEKLKTYALELCKKDMEDTKKRNPTYTFAGPFIDEHSVYYEFVTPDKWLFTDAKYGIIEAERNLDA